MKKCMVLMPFNRKDLNEHYKRVIKPAVETCPNYECYRVDEAPGATFKITAEIIRGIETSDVILANITGHNANVFYELGMAHSFGTNVLVICDKDEKKEIPFDIQEYSIFMYDSSKRGDTSLKKYLVDNLLDLQWLKRANNPVHDNSERLRFLLDFHPPLNIQYDNKHVAQEIYDEIKSWEPNKNIPQNSTIQHVICITGPVAIGKTTFSNVLAKVICDNEGRSAAQVLTLDGYMIDRKKLHKSMIPNGYDDRNWHLDDAKNDLSKLILNNEPIYIREYSHKCGTHLKDKIEVKPATYLILDGLISFNRGGRVCLDNQKWFLSDKLPLLMPLPAV